jgi:hypothetical protein
MFRGALSIRPDGVANAFKLLSANGADHVAETWRFLTLF